MQGIFEGNTLIHSPLVFCMNYFFWFNHIYIYTIYIKYENV
jgi:hypothetical protein